MRKIAIILVLLIVTAVILYNYVYKEHRNIALEEAKFSISAEAIVNEFQINPEKTQSKYLNHSIEITGDITSITTTEITLSQAVFCLFNEPLKNNYKLNESVTIKGRFIGYDDLLAEIKVDQCVLIK